MIYRRIYKIAMEKIEEIADNLLFPVTYCEGDFYIKFWYTIDGKEFADYSEALKHQIDCLMEEIEEE